MTVTIITLSFGGKLRPQYLIWVPHSIHKCSPPREKHNISDVFVVCREWKKKLEKKRCLFLHQGITIGHWSQPLNEHPSTNSEKKNKKKLNPPVLPWFAEVLPLRETLWKRYEPKRVHSQSTSAFSASKRSFFWLRSTGFWQLIDMKESVFVSRARLLGKLFFSTQISQYVKLQWGYSTNYIRV